MDTSENPSSHLHVSRPLQRATLPSSTAASRSVRTVIFGFGHARSVTTDSASSAGSSAAGASGSAPPREAAALLTAPRETHTEKAGSSLQPHTGPSPQSQQIVLANVGRLSQPQRRTPFPVSGGSGVTATPTAVPLPRPSTTAPAPLSSASGPVGQSPPELGSQRRPPSPQRTLFKPLGVVEQPQQVALCPRVEGDGAELHHQRHGSSSDAWNHPQAPLPTPHGGRENASSPQPAPAAHGESRATFCPVRPAPRPSLSLSPSAAMANRPQVEVMVRDADGFRVVQHRNRSESAAGVACASISPPAHSSSPQRETAVYPNLQDGRAWGHERRSHLCNYDAPALTPPAGTSPQREMRKLDDHQRQCVEADINTPLLIHAGAGSGKTRTIVCRIVHMINLGVNPYHILGLTFTRKSAESLRDRVAAELPQDYSHMAKQLRLCTLHSQALKILRDYGPPPGFENGFSIIDRKVMRETVEALLLREAEEWPAPFRNRTFVNDFLDTVEERRRSVEYSPLRKHYAGGLTVEGMMEKLYDAFQLALRVERRGMDFSDMQFYAVHMLETNEEVRLECQRRYRYVVVDEFQDLTRQQFRMVQLIVGDAARITCVGDPNQSIYAWRGAVENIFDHFRHAYQTVTEAMRLPINYRSSLPIVVAATSVVRNAEQMPKFPEGPPAVTFVASNAYHALHHLCEQAHSVVREASVRLGRSYRFGDVAVLTRRREDARKVAVALKEKGVPAQLMHRSAPDQSRWMQVLLANLNLVLSDKNDRAFLAALANPHPKWRFGTKFRTELHTAREKATAEMLMQQQCGGHRIEAVGGVASDEAGARSSRVSLFAVIESLVDNGWETLQERFGDWRINKPQRAVLEGWVRGIRRARSVFASLGPAVHETLQREGGDLAGTHVTTPLQEVQAVVLEKLTAIIRMIFGVIDFDNFDVVQLDVLRKRWAAERAAQQLAEDGPPATQSSGSGAARGAPVAIAGAPRSADDEGGDVLGADAEVFEEPSSVLSLLEEVAGKVVTEEMARLSQLQCSGASPLASMMLSLRQLLQQAVDEVTQVVQCDDFDAGHLAPDQVLVTTIHQSKGLEWPVVFIFGCIEGLLPLTRFDGVQSREEQRIIYVALSRAQELLHLYSWRESATSHINGAAAAAALTTANGNQAQVDKHSNAEPSTFIAKIPPSAHIMKVI